MTVQQVVGTKFQILFVPQDPNCGDFVEKKSAPHDFDTLKITRLHQWLLWTQRSWSPPKIVTWKKLKDLKWGKFMNFTPWKIYICWTLKWWLFGFSVNFPDFIWVIFKFQPWIFRGVFSEIILIYLIGAQSSPCLLICFRHCVGEIVILRLFAPSLKAQPTMFFSLHLLYKPKKKQSPSVHWPFAKIIFL